MLGASTQKSGLPTEYYAPNYKIEVEGHELDPETKGDVLQVKVTLEKKNLGGFELSINNWDDKRFDFKYSDTKTFDLGNRIHIQMGYADKLYSMIRGVITSLSPRFSESGPPTLSVGGLDGMVKLRDRKPGPNDKKQFVDMADWEIAQAVASRNGLQCKVTEEGEKHDIVIQKNQDEGKFLKERAARIDFDCFIQVDPESGQDTLYFVKPTDGRDGRSTRFFQFEWGVNLMNFTPVLKLSDQVSKVTVRGWDPTTKKAIVYTAGPEDLPPVGNGGLTGPKAAKDRLADKQDLVVDQPVTSAQEARELAMSLLRERAYEFLTGSGQVIGLPDLRPGDNVELLKLGQRFSGKYHVTKVEHTLGNSGYLTHFYVRSGEDGGTE